MSNKNYKAKYKGKCRDKNGYAVHLFYEYKGHEYMITDGHNGYSESIRAQHIREQRRIDEMLDKNEKNTETPKENANNIDEVIKAFLDYCNQE